MSALALTAITLYTLRQAQSPSSDKTLFSEFKATYNKSYGSLAEVDFRFSVFQSNLRKIESHNSDSTQTFTLGINKFADLSFTEFKNLYLLKNPITNSGASTLSTTNVSDLPATQDFRKTTGAVQPVKDQGQCGSCWAFSTVASMETALFQKNGNSVSLSEQELVDCSRSYGNYGCNGGLMTSAYAYVEDNQLGLESAYPYAAVDQTCSASKKSKGARYAVSSTTELGYGDVNDLQKLAAKQVVSVGIEVNYAFQLYQSGVFTSDASCGDYLNHGVAVVGYDTTASTPYFIVRNSWGPNWGLSGYINVAKATGRGTCGIANGMDVVPVI